MVFNIIIGFLIPWILGAYMYMKEKKIFLVIYPFGCAVSYTLNTMGFFFRFWNIKPYEYGIFSSLPLNLGLQVLILYSFCIKK